MSTSLVERTILGARGRPYDMAPIVTGRRLHGFVEYLAGDGFVYASDQGGPVYLGADSTRFAEFVQRLRVTGHALDLGSGSGILSQRLARTCDRVTAIDVVPEAVAASRTTLLTEQAPEGFDVVQEDLFDALEALSPVDAVIANLPFVPVPEPVAYSAYGDGGPTGLGLVERLLVALPPVLTSTSAFCLKVHCAEGPQGILAVPAIRRFLAAAGHVGCLIVEDDVPMAFRAGQSAMNARDLNPRHPDLLGAFDRHYQGLGHGFVHLVLVTESAAEAEDPGTLTVVDRRTTPTWDVSGEPASLARVLRRYGQLTATMPEGFEELGTREMVDIAADRAAAILEIASSGANLLQCVQEAVPEAATVDPLIVRGFVVPVGQLCRATHTEES